MSSKSLPNKVTKVSKNPSRPRAQGRKFEVIRHFDPSSNGCALYARIPIINVSDEEEVKMVDIQVNPKRNLPLSKKQEIVRNEQRTTHSSLLHHNAKAKKRIPPILQNNSCPSLKKSLNLINMRSKTFHKGNPTKILHVNKALKSASEKSLLKPTTGSIEAVVEPALIQRELTLQSLKREILEYKKSFPNQRDKLEILNSYKHDSLVKDLKTEILDVKTNNSLHKKILITELRSEIFQYQQFNKFQRYKSHEGSSGYQRQNCSAGSKKSELSHEDDEIMKSSNGKENSLEKGSRICVSEESTEDSLDGNSKVNSRGVNATRTDIASTSALIDR